MPVYFIVEKEIGCERLDARDWMREIGCERLDASDGMRDSVRRSVQNS